MEFKVLTIQQPWAYLLASGVKTIETRGWPTKFRGDLLIHAGKSEALWDTEFMAFWPWNEVLDDAKLRALEHGKIIGRVTVTDCIKTEELKPKLSKLEITLGDFGPKRFGWVCIDPVLFVHSIPAIGKQGLWTIDVDAEGEKQDVMPYEIAKQQRDKMIKKMLYLGYQMGYDIPRNDNPDQKYMTRGKVNYINVENWVKSKYSSVNKPMNKMTVDELRQVLSQFENVYKSFQKSY